jgi:hypothetical protein
MKLLKDWFTGPNNDNFEISRAMWAIGFLLGMGYQGYAIYQGQEFDLRTFAESLGIILVAGGAGTAVKDIGAGKSKS